MTCFGEDICWVVHLVEHVFTGNPEWNGEGAKPVVQKTTGMLEVNTITSLTTDIVVMQNIMNTHFNNIYLGWQQVQVNAVQQPPK